MKVTLELTETELASISDTSVVMMNANIFEPKFNSNEMLKDKVKFQILRALSPEGFRAVDIEVNFVIKEK